MSVDCRPIDPKPSDVQKMQTWSDFARQLSDWPLAKLKERRNQLINDQLKSFRPLGLALKRKLEACADDELPVVLIAEALKVGAIPAYLGYPPSNNCYKIEPFFWNFVVDDFETAKSVQEGIAPTILKEFEEQMLERELANRPLFIEESIAKRFLNLRPPSEARLVKEAHAIIERHRKRFPGVKMKKIDFINELEQRCYGCAKERAKNIWRNTVPENWRKPGRPTK